MAYRTGPVDLSAWVNARRCAPLQVLVHLPSAEVHILRQVVADALVLRREQVVVEHQEVRVLAHRPRKRP